MPDARRYDDPPSAPDPEQLAVNDDVQIQVFTCDGWAVCNVSLVALKTYTADEFWDRIMAPALTAAGSWRQP